MATTTTANVDDAELVLSQRWHEDLAEYAGIAGNATLVAFKAPLKLSALDLRKTKIFSLITQLGEFLKKKLYLNSRPARVLMVIGAIYALRRMMSSNSDKQKNKKFKRVAVVGSGIAGCGAAWTLNQSGVDVVLYEKKPQFGGNAKTFTWDFDGTKIQSGLAVLAWPHTWFHNYKELNEALNIKNFTHPLRFLVTQSDNQEDSSAELVFAHDAPEPLPNWAQQDLKNWKRLCDFTIRVNGIFQPCSYNSFYRMSFLNPLNLIKLRTLCKWFGLSDQFWTKIFVPVHTSTFLELNLDDLPAVMAETLESIMPLNETPTMSAWETDANEPIKRIVEQLPKGNARRSCAVEKVEYKGNKVLVTDEDEVTETFDAVVFACSARAMKNILHTQSKSNGCGWFMNWLERIVFDKTLYSHDRDSTFDQGVVHKHASVLPTKFRRNVLDDYCNYIEVDKNDPSKLENTFVLSSWCPTVHNTGDKSVENLFKNNDDVGMFVSYNARQKLDKKEIEWTSTSREAHPSLTTWQMFASQMLWPLLQGSRNGSTYFCGSAVTPGNGHDLSFLSGVIAATKLGAEYPFTDKLTASQDFDKLKYMMLTRANNT